MANPASLHSASPAAARRIAPILLVLIAALACSAGEESSAPGPAALAPGHPVEEVEVEFLDGKTRLAGTLFLPEATGLRPALVVLGGSDRGPRGRFKDQLARYVAEHGVAALSYDSPGTGRSK